VELGKNENDQGGNTSEMESFQGELGSLLTKRQEAEWTHHLPLLYFALDVLR